MLRVQSKYPKQRQWQRTHSLMTVIISVSKDVLSTGLMVFIASINDATGVAQVLAVVAHQAICRGETKTRTISIRLTVPCVIPKPNTILAIGLNGR